MSRALKSLVTAAVWGWAATASAASVVIEVQDGPGEGLNDPTPVAPVGGNPGTTRGQQRLAVLQQAAGIWGGLLQSNVTLHASARFDPLTCTASTGVLGSAGPTSAWADFAGAPLPGTWHVAALANARAGVDLAPDQPEIGMTFNSGIGSPGCLELNSFYLGLDGNHGGGIDLATVVLHELAHGLGFLALVNVSTGDEFLGRPDAFEARMFDDQTGQNWTAMTAAQRADSAEHARFVVWGGPQATLAVPATLAPEAPVLVIGAGLGEVPVGPALFGPPPANPPLQAQVVAAQDAGGASNLDGCEPIVNSVGGRIALVDRGICAFTTKVKNAQNAGALAVLMANDAPDSPPTAIGGFDPTIAIPSVQITRAAGVALRAALDQGIVTASLGSDPSRRFGADTQNRAILYTPSPKQPGSSLSHWDPFAKPNLLMEPSINPDLSHGVDLTARVLADLGWSLIGSGTPVPALPDGELLPVAGGLVGFGVWVLSRRRRA
jgi:PA domain